MPATSTSFFSNEVICGDFGTLTARAGPPASDEPAEDVKFSRVADLSRDFSERVRALGLNSDVYPLALRTCGWDIYDAHEWLDRMLRSKPLHSLLEPICFKVVLGLDGRLQQKFALLDLNLLLADLVMRFRPWRHPHVIRQWLLVVPVVAIPV